MPYVPQEPLVDMRRDAMAIFKAGLAAVEPRAAIHRHCQLDGQWLIIGNRRYDLSDVEDIHVVGAGKATASMAMAMEALLGDRITSGAINVKYGHDVDLCRIKQITAGHPVPDEKGVSGAKEIQAIASLAGHKDLVIGLISGGGSALLSLPVPEISLADKQETTRKLLACGATIHEINAFRKHLSQIKGGQLSRAAYPAAVASLILSDVVGDDLDVIASGPTVPDTSTFGDCLKIIKKYDLSNQLSEAVVNRIRAGVEGGIEETPKPGDPVFEKTTNRIIGSNSEALTAARVASEAKGYHTLVLSSMIEGDTTEAARMHAAIVKEILKTGQPITTPACILSGGETTVRVTGSGKGGRNQEFALVMARALSRFEQTVMLSAGTDGTDGPTDAAGAMTDHLTVVRACQMGMDPEQYLADNNAYPFFQRLDDLIITGPTYTNVMDLRVILVC